jgi:hypothetical protein
MYYLMIIIQRLDNSRTYRATLNKLSYLNDIEAPGPGSMRLLRQFNCHHLTCESRHHRQAPLDNTSIAPISH